MGQNNNQSNHNGSRKLGHLIEVSLVRLGAARLVQPLEEIAPRACRRNALSKREVVDERVVSKVRGN